MLQIQNISKQYKTGYLVQRALNGVSLNFRDSEFVSILGPSGSGKTTLLNIIGGLDRYDSGELIVNGISTKKYKDKDWDSYRNHTIGFVFQSYNLIPHQSILANVELALTISGISHKERRRRAKQVLEKVGLGDQLHKRPNQMSGGQMQRVAIARALVNDPDILLADEPTGALDTETSLQIMDLLHQVSKDRLVIMVTHNPELAERYATRTVRLRDGRVTDDSDPYDPDPEGGQLPAPEHRNMGRAKMSFLTALSLSFNNLRTKKGRTLLTSFAGSIGIIGIALILALSSSVNNYIADIQKDTMVSYPITISAEAFDISGMMAGGQRFGGTNALPEIRDGVYTDYQDIELSETVFASIIENNLTAFKSYLDAPDSEIHPYLGENGIVYTYDVSFDIFSYDANGALVSSSADVGAPNSSGGGFGAMPGGMGGMSMMGSSAGAKNFSELMAGPDGSVVSHIVTDSYELLYGAWPERFDEVVLVLDKNNALPAGTLYQLGLLSAEEYETAAEQIRMGEEAAAKAWSYEEISGHSFYLVPASSYYVENRDGTFSYIGGEALGAERLLEDALELKISGVIRPLEGAANANISTAVAYTSRLTDCVIQRTNESAVVLAQEADRETNVLNGMKFEAPDDDEKAAEASAYISAMGISDKASLYSMILYYSAADPQGAAPEEQQGQLQPAPEAGQMGAGMGGTDMDETAMAQALDLWLEETPDTEILLSIYEKYIGGVSYADNMKQFGKVSYDAPASISIYTDSFEDKNAVSDCIERYNECMDEAGKITYTDYVALLTNSITSMVNVISYVLIAFVAVSLVVSCIMIGIITHISVLERTKEIGILRALGASKHNISQVFNAETFIIGICAGLLGVGVSVLLTIPINAVLGKLLGVGALTVALPAVYAAILIVLSVVITMLGGLLPAKKAARQDPVIALRTE